MTRLPEATKSGPLARTFSVRRGTLTRGGDAGGRSGAGYRRRRGCSSRNGDPGESHVSSLRKWMNKLAERTGWKRLVENMAPQKHGALIRKRSRHRELRARCDLTLFLTCLLLRNKSRPALRAGRAGSQAILTADCRKTAGCACRRPRGRSSWSRRRSGTQVRGRRPNPAPPRRLRLPKAP